jgi:hypothetical protein
MFVCLEFSASEERTTYFHSCCLRTIIKKEKLSEENQKGKDAKKEDEERLVNLEG